MTDGRLLKGRAAEVLAAQHLERLGHEILFRNWRRRDGELDIVSRAPDGTCVFVEVRSRTGTDNGHPLEMVTPSKQRQVVRTARLFLAEEDVVANGYRFDVIGVLFDPAGHDAPEFVHVENAFAVA